MPIKRLEVAPIKPIEMEQILSSPKRGADYPVTVYPMIGRHLVSDHGNRAVSRAADSNSAPLGH